MAARWSPSTAARSTRPFDDAVHAATSSRRAQPRRRRRRPARPMPPAGPRPRAAGARAAAPRHGQGGRRRRGTCGSHGCEHEREVEHAPVDRGSACRSSPRSTRSWATKAATGPGSRWGASSAQVWRRRGHLGQRAERVLAGAFDEHAAGPVAGPVEGEPVLGEAAAGQSWRPVSRANRQASRRRSRPGPVARRRRPRVDRPEQAVEVAAVDEALEAAPRPCGSATRAARGSGGRSRRSGTPSW